MNPVLGIIVVVLAIVLKWISSRQSGSRKAYNLPPGPPRLPLIGSYLHLLWLDYKRPHVSLQKLAKVYKSPVIGFGMGPYNAVAACDYKTCKEVFTNPSLQGRLIIYPVDLRTFSKKCGIFSNDGDDWLHLRRNTLRSLRDFGFGKRSENFEAIMEEETRSLVGHLTNMNGKPVVLPDELYPTLFNMILSLIHGIRIPPQERSILKDMGRTAIRIITATDGTGRLLAVWPWLRYISPSLSGETEIEESTKLFRVFVEESYGRHSQDFDEEILRDLIDVFLKYKKLYPKWTDENILVTCEDFMFPNAALCVVLTFTLAFLAQNPDKIRKCQQEIDEVVGRGRLPNLNDRQRLLMVESCLRETMRIQVLTPLSVPHRATEDTTLGGYDVPADSLVLVNLHAMHNDPEVWKDPENYRPERFLHSNTKDTTLPFGLGKRVCAAETYARQNLFIVLATILQNFNLEIDVPLDSKRYRYGGAVTPNPDFSMRFIPRP